jgi:hypothetical protein
MRCRSRRRISPTVMTSDRRAPNRAFRWRSLFRGGPLSIRQASLAASMMASPTQPLGVPILWAAAQRRFGIGAKVVGHARTVAFQMAEVAISKNLLAGLDGDATAVPAASSASGHYGTGDPLRKSPMPYWPSSEATSGECRLEDLRQARIGSGGATGDAIGYCRLPLRLAVSCLPLRSAQAPARLWRSFLTCKSC